MMTRAELSRQPQFSEISPELGSLDEDALEELLRDDPDEALGLLASMTSATDRKLRELSRALAGRLMLDVARRGPGVSRRVGRIVTTRWRPTGGDIDVDGSVDTLVEAAAMRAAIDVDGLRQRNWSRPATAICLLVDRSGSTTGQPLATNAVAAAAVAWRNPDDFSVVSFARQAIVVKAQGVHRPVVDIVEAVLALRGFGTTDLAAAIDAARRQLERSHAARKITVLLSDCRATEPGDAAGTAGALDELVVIAPAADADEARAFSGRTGARLATVGGPSDVPGAIAELLH
jgi:Mg-chelatase subunit ChlD